MRKRLVAAVAATWLVISGCGSEAGSTPTEVGQCSAEPVEALPDPGDEGDFMCADDGWFQYSDQTCGPPSAPGCITNGDGRCYKPCVNDADCCGLKCEQLPLFQGSDTPRQVVSICRESSD